MSSAHAPTQTSLIRHNRNVPRYTSYPTVPHFHDGIGAKDYESWLAALAPETQLSLYVHIPYCRALCWYCGCNTKATRQYSPVAAYLDYLRREIDMIADRLPTRMPVSHIHFGGGSPSLLTAADFDALAGHITDRFALARDYEMAIEIDPRELTEPRMAAYAKAGVNRVSFGIQDFHADVQSAINRRQPFYQVYDAVALARTYGVDAINMDLLYGLPHQTEAGMRANVDFAHALKPSRIALFGYAHVPWMKKHMRLIDETALPDASARARLFDVAADRLGALGYRAVGLDHFVQPDDSMAAALDAGTLRRNFQGYTTDQADSLIGFGVSSIGALPQGYVQSIADTRSYFRALDENSLPIAKGLRLSPEDRLRRGIIEELMCTFQVDLEAHCAWANLPIRILEPSLDALAPLIDDGLVSREGSLVRVAPGARQAVRLVCAAFDAYLTDRANQHAQVA